MFYSKGSCLYNMVGIYNALNWRFNDLKGDGTTLSCTSQSKPYATWHDVYVEQVSLCQCHKVSNQAVLKKADSSVQVQYSSQTR